MRLRLPPLVLVLAISLLPTSVFAYANGPPTGCGGCHGGGSFGSTVQLIGPTTTPVVGGTTVDLTIRVSAANPDPVAAGFLIYSDQAGLSSLDPNVFGDNQIRAHGFPVPEPNTTTYPKSVDFQVQWTAPNADVNASFIVEGNVVNGDLSTSGDSPAFDSFLISVCADNDLDGICNANDFCQDTADPQNGDCDLDGDGDVCDFTCPNTLACAGKCPGGTCGDSILNLGEACDPPNEAGGCDSECHQSAVCGNTSLEDVFETCDDGNTEAGDYCSADCGTVTGACGDAILQSNEACDCGNPVALTSPCGAGVRNGDASAGCSSATCSKTSVCGNGVVELAFEACDDSNVVSGDYCSADCSTITGRCGDGVTQGGEDCDCGDGSLGTPTPCAASVSNGGTSGCSLSCHKTAVCGDGVVSPAFEVCYDSNTQPSDGCGTDCAQIDVGFACAALGVSCQVTCGDGIVAGPERCDDGPANSSTQPDACRPSCVSAFCGDGVIDAKEACDNGDQNSDTASDACRTHCNTARCGDRIVDLALGETCDDGNLRSGDGCSPTCQLESCGDGVVDESEECDDGAANDDQAPNACRSLCVRSFCGDGIVDDGEVCDGGRVLSGTCTGTCTAFGISDTTVSAGKRACSSSGLGVEWIAVLLVCLIRRRQ